MRAALIVAITLTFAIGAQARSLEPSRAAWGQLARRENAVGQKPGPHAPFAPDFDFSAIDQHKSGPQ